MRKYYHSLLCLLLISPLVFNSCKNDSDEETELVSEVGIWNLTDVEYYYDGTLLDYKDFTIGVWPTSRKSDCTFYVSHGGFILNGDGTGKAFGLGEFETDEFDITYTKEGKKIRISLMNNGREVTCELIFENNQLRNSSENADIYGWSPDRAEEVSGADGNHTHKLETIQIYTKKK